MALFSAAWLVVQAGVGSVLVAQGMSADPGYPVTARNVAGILAFQLFLSGTSEEVMYRGLILTSFLALWRRCFATERTLALVAVSAATVVFMADHINIAFSPFRITHFNVLQQGTVLIFGIFYGVVYVRTRSLLGPVVAHGLLNVIIVTTGLLLFHFFGG